MTLCYLALPLTLIVCIYLQTRKICPVFKLLPSTIYKEYDTIAVFPHETSGQFNTSLIDPSAVYEASGEDVKAAKSTSTAHQSAGSALGAYTGPTAQLPPRQPVHRREGISFHGSSNPLDSKSQQANDVKASGIPSNHTGCSHSRSWPV